MINKKISEDLIIHKLDPQVVSSVYTREIKFLGIRIHKFHRTLNTSYNTNIFSDEKDKGIGFKK